MKYKVSLSRYSDVPVIKTFNDPYPGYYDTKAIAVSRFVEEMQNANTEAWATCNLMLRRVQRYNNAMKLALEL